MKGLELLTPPQAARLKGCSQQAIHQAIAEGRLRAYTFGDSKERQHYLISRYELALYEPRKYQRRRHWPLRRRQAWETLEQFNARVRENQRRRAESEGAEQP